MYSLLLILLLADCLALSVVILLQSGKGGGLAAGFGGAGTGIEMMGSRQTASFLHNATKWLGGAFLVICFALSLLTVKGTAPRSLIENEMQGQGQPEAGQPAGAAPTDLQSVLEGQGQTEQGQPGQGQPAAQPAQQQGGSSDGTP